MMRQLIYGVVCLTAVALSGCAGDADMRLTRNWALRHGPDTDIKANEVIEDSKQKAKILAAFKASALGGTYDAETGRSSVEPNYATNSNDGYAIVNAGFNYIDGKCHEYLVALYELNKTKDEAKGILSSLDNSSNAVLGITNASPLAMVILKQSFGLITNINDEISKSFLWNMPPSTIFNTIEKLQQERRDYVKSTKDQIKSDADVYQQIRTYLMMCEPISIEANIIKAVDNAKAVTKKTETDTDTDKTGKSGTDPSPPAKSLNARTELSTN